HSRVSGNPRAACSRFVIWVPAFAGTSGWYCRELRGERAAISVRSLSRLRGRGGEGDACTNLDACPLPVPPPQAGEGTQEPIMRRPGRERRGGGVKRRHAPRAPASAGGVQT